MEKERIIEQTTSGGTGISSGFLRTKISLKGNQSQLSLVSPFYGMKPELPRKFLPLLFIIYFSSKPITRKWGFDFLIWFERTLQSIPRSKKAKIGSCFISSSCLRISSNQSEGRCIMVSLNEFRFWRWIYFKFTQTAYWKASNHGKGN